MTTQTPPTPQFPVFDFDFQEIRRYIESINGIKTIAWEIENSAAWELEESKFPIVTLSKVLNL